MGAVCREGITRSAAVLCCATDETGPLHRMPWPQHDPNDNNATTPVPTRARPKRQFPE